MNDLEFIRRFIKKDKRVREQFLKKYPTFIYSCIHSVLSSRGYTFAEQHVPDIFQGVFESLVEDNCRKLKSFKGLNGCSFPSWLKQVTINFTIDYLRMLKPAVSIDEEVGDEVFLKDILADDCPSASENIILREKLSVLKSCISELDKNARYFIELNFNRGLKLEKIRRHLKLSRGAIDMYKSRIMDKLRECFSRKGFPLEF
jgi:RNA polymerase sigma factor (sigma-70 family)